MDNSLICKKLEKRAISGYNINFFNLDFSEIVPDGTQLKEGEITGFGILRIILMRVNEENNSFFICLEISFQI